SDVTGDSELHVEAGFAKQPGTIVERIVSRRWLNEFAAARQVRHQIQMAAGFDSIEAFQIIHSRSGAAVVLGNQLKPYGLILPLDEARSIDAPHLDWRCRESELGERDAKFGRPAVIRDPNGGLPDAF